MDEFFNSIINEFNWSLFEILAVLFSIIYVTLAAKESIWCWAAALISVSIYIYICFQAQLYAETGLQVFYFIMAIYGYFSWSKSNSLLKINELAIRHHILIMILGSLLTFLLGFYLSTYTDTQLPIVDSFTTVFSIIATYMVVKKILSNWLYFIIIDTVSIYLYFSRDLHLTALLFSVYTIIAIIGYWKWSQFITENE
ncbi:MAG: nicotinamide mononucleotide transporter [Flavobacteriales bacterium]|jgi:nicotinamide mononucleotide transporter|nr:nicotinamide mononucleotide transporter [Flavobacteriales bacterium]